MNKKIESRVDFVQLDGYTLLKCPQCAFTNLHPTSISVLRGNDRTTINGESITVKEEKNNTRGVNITLEYHCENGHDGELIFQFYKGEILVKHKILKTREPKEWETIWRD